MIWVIGSGYMGREYAKVLSDLEVKFLVIGRSEKKCKDLSDELGLNVKAGGLEASLQTEQCPSAAIVCVTVEELYSVTSQLVQFGVRDILVEKPGALSISELKNLKKLAEEKKSNIRIGYNRMFYQSVLIAEKMIANDGGAIAVHLELTEWAHQLKNNTASAQVKQRWLYANTSHVIDMGLNFLGGGIAELSCFRSGSLDWHPSSSRFVGSGLSESGVLFSYIGCWDGPGRWGVEIITPKNRYLFKPLENLQIQKLGSIKISECNGIDYSLDEAYKPGLYLQTANFLKRDYSRLKTIDQQITLMSICTQIGGYKH